MKIHYALHVLMLGGIVYLAAQVNNSSNNSVAVNDNSEIKIKDIDTSKFNKEINSLKKELSEKAKEIQLLKKSNDVAQDKIKGLRNEITDLSNKSPEERNKQISGIQNQIQDLIGSSLKDFTPRNFDRKKYHKRYYQRLFDKLNLSEEQQEEFLSLLSNNSGMSFMSINGVPVDSNQKNSSEIKEFLGDNYEDYLKYQQTSMERGQLDRMNRKLGDEDKLSAEQHEQLTDILHQKKMDRMAGKDVNNDDYLNQSSDILNDKQQQAFEKQLKSNNSIFSLGGGNVGAITISQ